MKNYTRKYLVALLAVLFLSTCAEKKFVPMSSQLKDLTWLQGKWQGNLMEQYLYENWDFQSDSLMTGLNYSLAGNDTNNKERVRIFWKKGEIFYAPTVENQNSGAEILFKLIPTDSKSQIFIFENPNHDFPQRIVYKRIGLDSMRAGIEGLNKEGKLMELNYKLGKLREIEE